MRETICLPVIESFLRALRPSGPWTLTAIYKKDDGPPDLPVVHTADLAVIRAFCLVHAGTNLYYQANETKDVWKKASAADLANVSFVHVDIDHDEMGNRMTEPKQKAQMLARLLCEHPHPTYQPGAPDLVVDSGNGIQALWRFDARPATEENVELLGRANRWILEEFGGDKGTWNPSQLLRLPGTSNYPDKKKRAAGITAIKSARLMHNKPRPAIGIGHFELAPPFGEIPFKEAKSIQAVAVGIDELQLDYNLPDWLVNLVKLGENPGEEHGKSWSRSEWLFKAVCALVRYGVPGEYIKGLLLDSVNGISESVLDDSQQRSADDYAERQVRRAQEAVHNSEIKERIDEPIHPSHLTGEDDDEARPEGELSRGPGAEGETEAAPKKEKRPPKFKLWTGSELAAMPSLSWQIEDMLPKGSVAQLYGPTKQYKTFVALDMALCVASGMPFHGKLVSRARVVYVAAEGQYDIYPRFRAWCIERGIVEAALDDWFRVCQDAVAVDDIKDSGELTCFTNAIYAVKAFMPVGFVIFDTLSKNMNGDEKDSHAMSLFVKGCELVKDAFGATVLIIHHTGHNTTRARGSSVLVSAVDVSMRCAKIEKLPHRAKLTVEHIRAARGGWHMDLQTHEIQIGEATRASTLVMRLVKEEEAIRITTRDRVLMSIATSQITLGNEVSPKLTVRVLEGMLKGVRGCGHTAIAAARNALREEGLLDKGYRLTPKGMERATELQNIHGSIDEDEEEEETEQAA